MINTQSIPDDDDFFDDDYSDEDQDTGIGNPAAVSDIDYDKQDTMKDSSWRLSTYSIKKVKPNPKLENASRKKQDSTSDSTEDHDEFGLFPTLLRKSNAKLGGNDAIKIVSTPNGKVGIVYQANPDTSMGAGSNEANVLKSGGDISSQLDTVEEKSETENRRIQPVLTKDGKVALLYRGGGSSSAVHNKYEPIRNLTMNNFSNKDNNNSSRVADNLDNEATTVRSTTSTTTTTISSVDENKIDETTLVYKQNKENEEDNVILPNINRPLSEVLGIKKNQFSPFRVTDELTRVSQPMSPAQQPDSTERRYPPHRSRGQSGLPSYGDDYPDYTVKLDDNSLNAGVDQEVASSTSSPSSIEDVLQKTEVVNLAIIPAFESEIDMHEFGQSNSMDGGQHHHHHHHEGHRGHHRRHRPHNNNNNMDEDLTAIHCAMQALVALAAMATVFGMLGAYFKTRILDQLNVMHW